MEIFKNSWKDIKYYPTEIQVENKIKELFGSLFTVEKILFDDVGYIIFKIHLKAFKKGVIINKSELGIIIKVFGQNDSIENEVKKNNLVYENRPLVEIRVNDVLIFYLSHSKFTFVKN